MNWTQNRDSPSASCPALPTAHQSAALICFYFQAAPQLSGQRQGLSSLDGTPTGACVPLRASLYGAGKPCQQAHFPLLTEPTAPAPPKAWIPTDSGRLLCLASGSGRGTLGPTNQLWSPPAWNSYFPLKIGSHFKGRLECGIPLSSCLPLRSFSRPESPTAPGCGRGSDEGSGLRGGPSKRSQNRHEPLSSSWDPPVTQMPIASLAVFSVPGRTTDTVWR